MKSTPVVLKLEQIRTAVDEAMATAETAVHKAMRVGLLLIEIKPLVAHGEFQTFIEKNIPRISYQTANRWMAIAERTLLATRIDPLQLSAPPSELLGSESEAWSPKTRQAHQLLFDFTSGKTMKELRECVVEGEDAHRITRAHNGRTKGGTHGEDRKDYPTFIGRALKAIGAHLKTWKSYTPAQVETTLSKFACISKWPTPLLHSLKQIITDELKTR